MTGAPPAGGGGATRNSPFAGAVGPGGSGSGRLELGGLSSLPGMYQVFKQGLGCSRLLLNAERSKRCSTVAVCPFPYFLHAMHLMFVSRILVSTSCSSAQACANTKHCPCARLRLKNFMSQTQTGSLSSGALNLGAFQSADLDQLVSHYPPEVSSASAVTSEMRRYASYERLALCGLPAQPLIPSAHACCQCLSLHLLLFPCPTAMRRRASRETPCARDDRLT